MSEYLPTYREHEELKQRWRTLRDRLDECERTLLQWHLIFVGADLCAGCVAEWNVSMKRVHEEDGASDD